jgi:hypothetical protein
MTHRIPWLVGLLIVAAPVVASAQQWSGIIAPQRATEWRTAGAAVVNRTTRCGATIAAYSGSSATINSAISACPSGQYVELGAGTFTLSSSITLNKSGVTLRGAGAGSTRLVFTGTSSGCGIFFNAAVRMCTENTRNIGCTTGCGGPGPDNSAGWTAGYAKGTTVITLSNTTGLAVGSPIFLDQLSDTVDGYPAAGDLYICEGGSDCNANGGNFYARTNRVHVEVHIVTAINGLNVTIDPPIHAPSFRLSQLPGAWWANANTALSSTGIENLTIDFTGAFVGIEFVNAANVWAKGVRLINRSTAGSNAYHVIPLLTFRGTVTDSYFYGPITQGNVQYAYTPHLSGSLLFQNNIVHHPICAACAGDPESGSVYAYNYIDGSHYDSLGFQPHNAGDFYNLWEGNNAGNFFADSIYGPHMMHTLFRNHFDGTAHNSGMSASGSAFDLVHGARFINAVGNVVGGSPFTTYQTTTNTDNKVSVFHLGYEGNCGACATLGFDSNVQRTLMRWGNWDSVTNSTRFVASEVPSSITNFANPIPASQVLPPSFYLAARPPWFTTPWGTPPWPPIGPDVTGGDISSSPTGGHANKIPARLCFENTDADPVYSGSNPPVRLFDASSCYGQVVQSAPSAPSPPGSLTLR